MGAWGWAGRCKLVELCMSRFYLSSSLWLHSVSPVKEKARSQWLRVRMGRCGWELAPGERRIRVSVWSEGSRKHPVEWVMGRADVWFSRAPSFVCSVLKQWDLSTLRSPQLSLQELCFPVEPIARQCRQLL